MKDLNSLFDPAGYLGASGEFIDRVLAAHSALQLPSCMASE